MSARTRSDLKGVKGHDMERQGTKSGRRSSRRKQSAGLLSRNVVTVPNKGLTWHTVNDDLHCMEDSISSPCTTQHSSKPAQPGLKGEGVPSLMMRISAALRFMVTITCMSRTTSIHACDFMIMAVKYRSTPHSEIRVGSVGASHASRRSRTPLEGSRRSLAGMSSTHSMSSRNSSHNTSVVLDSCPRYNTLPEFQRYGVVV